MKVVAVVDYDVVDNYKMKLFLESSMKEAGFSKSDVVIIPLYHEPYFKLEPSAIREYAESDVLPEIRSIKPDLVIPFGNNAICSVGVSKKAAGINSLRGVKCQSEELPDTLIVPTVSIFATFRSPQGYEPFMCDLKYAFTCVKGIDKKAEDVEIIMLDTPDMVLSDLLESARRTGECAYDYETSGLDAWACLAVTATYVTGEKNEKGAYIVYAYAGYDLLNPRFDEDTLSQFRGCFETFYKEAGVTYDLIGFNTGFDDWVAETHCGGVELPGSQWDAQIMKWCYNSDRPNDLKNSTSRYLGFPNYDSRIDQYVKDIKHRRTLTIRMSTEEGKTDYACIKTLRPDINIEFNEPKSGKYKGDTTWKWPEDLDKGIGAYAMIPLDDLLYYNALDSVYTLKLKQLFTTLLEEDELVDSYYLRHEANRVLWKVEQRGMVLDVDVNREFSSRLATYAYAAKKECHIKAEEVDAEFVRSLGDDFNPDSAQQVAKILYGDTGLIPKIDRRYLCRYYDESSVNKVCDDIESVYYSDMDAVKNMLREGVFSYDQAEDTLQDDFYEYTGDPRTLKFIEVPLGLGGLEYDPPAVTAKTGAPSCSKSSLLTLAKKRSSDFLSLVLMYRKATKIKKVFVDNVFKNLRSGGVASASYNVTGPATARISSSSRGTVNKFQWQNFPKDMRGQFKARDGMTFITLDYSAAEVRVLAAFCQDENLIEALKSEDIHRTIASKVFKKAPEEVTKDERSRSKSATFLILYGGGADKLAASFGITKAEAQDIIDKLYEAFPGLKAWMDYVIQSVKDGPHFVRTAVGTRRWLLNILSEDLKERLKAERQAVNSKIQGTAGELTLIKFIEILMEALDMGYLNVYLAATVHDSMTFEVPEDLAWNDTKVTIVVDDNGDTKEIVTITPAGPMVDLIYEVCRRPVDFGPLGTVDFPIDLEVSKYWDGAPNLVKALDGKSEAEAFRYDLITGYIDEDTEDEELI